MRRYAWVTLALVPLLGALFSASAQPAASFAADPGWDGHDNRRSYETTDVRPRFDFGQPSAQSEV